MMGRLFCWIMVTFLVVLQLHHVATDVFFDGSNGSGSSDDNDQHFASLFRYAASSSSFSAASSLSSTVVAIQGDTGETKTSVTNDVRQADERRIGRNVTERMDDSLATASRPRPSAALNKTAKEEKSTTIIKRRHVATNDRFVVAQQQQSPVSSSATSAVHNNTAVAKPRLRGIANNDTKNGHVVSSLQRQPSVVVVTSNNNGSTNVINKRTEDQSSSNNVTIRTIGGKVNDVVRKQEQQQIRVHKDMVQVRRNDEHAPKQKKEQQKRKQLNATTTTSGKVQQDMVQARGNDEHAPKQKQQKQKRKQQNATITTSGEANDVHKQQRIQQIMVQPRRNDKNDPKQKQQQQKPKQQNAIKVFIGIKTTITRPGHYGDRMRQIQETWLHDVMKELTVDLQFFANVRQVSTIQNNDDTASSWINPTPGCGWGTRSLPCMNQVMFNYFLNHYTTHGDNDNNDDKDNDSSMYSPWFCSFDDDNYVLLDSLLNVLQEYEEKDSNNTMAATATNLYIGRPSVPAGIPWPELGRRRVHFLTGGAGYCITNHLMTRGANYFSNFTNICVSLRLPDDMCVGYVVNTLLGINQTFDERFHSHYEHSKDFPLDDVPHQVSFGYNTKFHHEEAMQHFPNVPVLFDAQEDDPLLFKSLRSFLLSKGEEQQ